MNFSTNNYTINIEHSIVDITERLLRNTLEKKTLMRSTTDKRFIGQVNENGFRLISSSKIGVLCVAEGQYTAVNEKNTTIEIRTKLQTAFVILYACWFIVISTVAVVFCFIDPKNSSFSGLPVMFVIMVLARGILHLAYVRSRNMLIDEIELTLR